MSAKKPKIQKIEAPKTNNRVEQLRYLAAIRGELEQEAPKLNVKRFLIVSAIITPTTDVFTLFVVALPIWLLYEVSILIVRPLNDK